jgi:UDP-N-acetylglucosamine 2-epimerase
MKLLSIVGTRPQYVKLTAIVNAAIKAAVNHDWIDTGQHYSTSLSSELIQEFNLPSPKLNLMIGSGTHGAQTAKMLEGIETFLIENPYDMVLVYGDTNSTLAGALAASKLGIPIAHVEAGLRSGNMEMPEEKNRKMVDHISNLLFAPTQLAVDNLKKEGLESIVHSGDIMYDVLQETVIDLKNDDEVSLAFVLATIHRVENTESKDRLEKIIRELEKLPLTVILPAHPRLLQRLDGFGIKVDKEKINLVEPLSHKDLLQTVIKSKCVVTDSGGLQKEAFMLRKICITARHETEWPETLEYGWNVLNPCLENLNEMINRDSPRDQSAYFGDGNAAGVILREIKARYGGKFELGASS